MRRAVSLEPGQGRSVSLRGTKVQFTVESTHAKGASCTEWEAAPGFDTGLHVHERLEETWYVLDREFEFHLEEETFIATAGATVFVPPHVTHSFANRGDVPAKFLTITSPPGHDPLLRRARGDPRRRWAARWRSDRRAAAPLRHRPDLLAHR